MNRSRMVTHVGAAIAGAITVAACGSQTAIEQQPGGAEEMQRRVIALDERISGSARQREAVDYLSWRSWSDPVVSCMHERGFEYPLEFVSVRVGWTSSGPSPWLAEPGRRTVSEHYRRSAKQNRILDADPPPEPGTPQDTAAYQESVDVCAKKAGDPLPPIAPPESEIMKEEFDVSVQEIDDRVGDPERYRTCMAEHGIDLVDDSDGWDATYIYLTGELPPSRLVPLIGEPVTPEWEHFLAVEKDVLTADTSCRQSTYRDGLPQLASAADKFTADYADELTALDSAWEQVVHQAERMGWTPQS